MYALFRTSPGDRVTYTINPSSHCNPNHLSYFKFVGRVVAKAVYDNRLLECYFTRSFYKHILGKSVRYLSFWQLQPSTLIFKDCSNYTNYPNKPWLTECCTKWFCQQGSSVAAIFCSLFLECGNNMDVSLWHYKVHWHGERGLPILPGLGVLVGERCVHAGLRADIQHGGLCLFSKCFN